MSAIDSLIKIKFYWNLFEIGFSNYDSVVTVRFRNSSDLNLHSLLICPFSRQ